MTSLPEELRMVSNMIHMGERIQYGRETTLMDKAAGEIERLQALAKAQAEEATLYMNAQTPEEQAREHKGTVTHTTGKATINLAEAVVVGDWEAELEKYKEPTELNGTVYYRLPINKLTYLIAAKDRDINNAYKLGYEVGSLN